MAEKKNSSKKRSKNKPVQESEPTLAASENEISKNGFREFIYHPKLLLASISFAVTMFSVGAAFQSRNDLTLGVIREPSVMILWAGITVTLFASYAREKNRSSNSDS